MKTENLRFAPIIRVSTEKQKLKGSSLDLQRKQITHAVSGMGGSIPDQCWRYVGQESATTENERLLLDQLLSFSSGDLLCIQYMTPSHIVTGK